MKNHLVSNWIRAGAVACGSALLVGALALSARATPFVNVDAETSSGNMEQSFVSASDNAGQYTINLTISNTGAQPYTNVNLVEQFVWSDSNLSNVTPVPYVSNNDWSGNSLAFSISGYSINGGTLTSPSSFTLSNANTPLTYSPQIGTGPSQSMLSSDVVPSIPLGDFAPSGSLNLTLVLNTSPDFPPQLTGFLVAVPEPATIALLAIGGVGLVAYRLRRKRFA